MPAKGWRKDEQESNFDTMLHNEHLSIDTFLFPKSTINKLAKSALHENTNDDANYLLGKDSQIVIQRASILFTNFIYHHAKQLVKMQNRKVVNADDILNALTQVGFSDFLPVLNNDLDLFNKKKQAKKLARAKAKEANIAGASAEIIEDADVDDEENGHDNEINKKKPRLGVFDDAAATADDDDETMSDDESTMQHQNQSGIIEEDDNEDDDDDDEEEDDEIDNVKSHLPSQLELEQKELTGEDPDNLQENANNDEDDEIEDV